MTLTYDIALCCSREVGEAGPGAICLLHFTGRKHAVLEDELNFAVVFSVGDCSHL